MFTEEGLGNLNYSQYVNPEIQSMLNEAMSTVDTEARAELYRQAMELAEQDAIYVPLYEYPDLWAQNIGLSGEYRLNSVIEFGRFSWN